MGFRVFSLGLPLFFVGISESDVLKRCSYDSVSTVVSAIVMILVVVVQPWTRGHREAIESRQYAAGSGWWAASDEHFQQ